MGVWIGLSLYTGLEYQAIKYINMKLPIKIFIVIVFIMLSTTSFAQSTNDWNPISIGTNSDGELVSITMNQNYHAFDDQGNKKMWIRTEESHKVPGLYGTVDHKIEATEKLFSFDCSGKRMKLIVVITKDIYDNDKVINSRFIPIDEQQWVDVIPGTDYETIIEKICIPN